MRICNKRKSSLRKEKHMKGEEREWTQRKVVHLDMSKMKKSRKKK